MERTRSTGVDLVHRLGAGVIGLVLWAFAGLGFANGLTFFDTRGVDVAGLSSNGLLSVVSVVVGAVLLLSAVRGGRTASTVATVVGGLFLLSGVVNVLLLGTAYNLLAFRMSNVVFSLVTGGILLVIGSYGRFAGRLRADSPYASARGGVEAEAGREPGGGAVPTRDAAAARSLAEAERAVAENRAEPAVARRLAALARVRRPEDRISEWRRLSDE